MYLILLLPKLYVQYTKCIQINVKYSRDIFPSMKKIHINMSLEMLSFKIIKGFSIKIIIIIQLLISLLIIFLLVDVLRES